MAYQRFPVRIAGAMAFLLSLNCVAQTSRPEYGIKFEEPPIGSHIRREAVRGSPVPINRKYGELTTEERAVVHSWYEKIGPDDEPPFPSDGTRPILDAVRKGQSKLLVTGELLLVATVEANGEVSTVKAIGSPSPAMTKFASTVLMLTKFKPAVCGGSPCKGEFPLWFDFRVE